MRYNNSSILRRLDLDDIDSVKRVAKAIDIALKQRSTNLQHHRPTGIHFEGLENAWVDAVLSSIERNANYPLLERAMVRFSAAGLKSRAHLEEAIIELEGLADEGVLITPEAHIDDYIDALKRFEALPQSRIQRMQEDRHVRILCFWHLRYLLTVYIVPCPRGSKRQAWRRQWSRYDRSPPGELDLFIRY